MHPTAPSRPAADARTTAEAPKPVDVRRLAAELLPAVPTTSAEDPARAVIRLRPDAAVTLKTIWYAATVMYGRPLSPNAIVRAALNELGRKVLAAIHDEARQEGLLRELAKATVRMPYTRRKPLRRTQGAASGVL